MSIDKIPTVKVSISTLDGPGANTDPSAMPLTCAELKHVLDHAKRIKLQHKVYQQVSMEWGIDERLMALTIEMRAAVINRDVTAGMLRELEELSADDQRERAMNSLVAIMRGKSPTSLALLPVVARIPIRVTSAQAQEPGLLVRHLAREARKALLYFMEHEIDEMLLVDGIRENDPHEPQFKYTVKV